MNLNAYFKCHGHQAAGEVAKKAGTTLGYLRGCLYGQRRMSADMAIRLEAATDGEMTAIELRPDLPWRGFSSAGVHLPDVPMELPDTSIASLEALADMLGVSVEVAAEMAAEKAAQSRDRRQQRRAKIIQLRLDRAAKGAQ